MSLNELDPLLLNCIIYGKLVHFDTRSVACSSAACASLTPCYTIAATSFAVFGLHDPPCYQVSVISLFHSKKTFVALFRVCSFAAVCFGCILRTDLH